MTTNNKRWLAVLAVAIVLPLVLYRINSKKTQKNNCPDALRIGVASGYAPWALRNDQGELVGFDVAIAYEIGTRLKVPVTLVDMSPEMLMASVRANKLDCMVAPMAITPEREQAFNMVHYQGAATALWPMMIKKDNPHVSLRDNLGTKTIVVGALSGTKQAEYALSLSHISTLVYDSMAHVLLALRRGAVDAALLDPDLGMRLKTDNPDMTVTLIDVSAEYQSRGNGIAINKERKDLADMIARAIQTMKDDGYIARQESAWGIGRLS